MSIEKCTENKLSQVQVLLQSCNLPTDDIDEASMDHFYIIKKNNAIAAVIGIEIKGYIALIRSLAVAPTWRGQGLGESLYKHVEVEAQKAGIVRLFLLTATAQKYFQQQGYSPLERELAPLPIKQSPQFQSLGPESVPLMEKSLMPVEGTEHFDAGLYCAESVLSAVAKHYDITSELVPAISTGLCSGMSRTCGTCGALTGGILATGLMLGRKSEADSVDKTYRSVQTLISEFESLYGSSNCQTLLGCDLGNKIEQQRFRDNNLTRRCREYTKLSAEITLSLIEKERKHYE